MTMTRFLPGGQIRKIFEATDREAFHAKPRRASRVEVVDCPGPSDGRFFVCFSPLSDLPEHQVCLRETFEEYQAAVSAELEWLKENWIEHVAE